MIINGDFTLALPSSESTSLPSWFCDGDESSTAEEELGFLVVGYCWMRCSALIHFVLYFLLLRNCSGDCGAAFYWMKFPKFGLTLSALPPLLIKLGNSTRSQRLHL